MTLQMMGLVPSVIAVKDEVSISEAAGLYKDDLPRPNLLDKEFRRWKNKWRTKRPSSRPNSVEISLKVCVRILFQIYIYIYIYIYIIKNCNYHSCNKLCK